MNKPSRIDPFLGDEVVAVWLLWFCLDTLIAGIATFVMGIGLRWVSVWLEVEPPALVHSPRDLVKGWVISVALMVVFLKIRRWRRRRKHPLATRSFLLGQHGLKDVLPLLLFSAWPFLWGGLFIWGEMHIGGWFPPMALIALILLIILVPVGRGVCQGMREAAGR